jgi:cytoskeletal protein CcmA (bactofilin family)
MSCLSELRCSIYADDELPREEIRAVEQHLAMCPRCRAAVAAMRAENRLLAEIFHADESEIPSGVESGRHVGAVILWTAACVAAVVISAEKILELLTQYVPGGASEWFNPLERAGQMNMLVSAVFYMVEQGAGMLESIIALAGIVLALLAVFWILRAAVKRRLAPIALVAGLALGFALPSTARAAERRKGAVVTVKPGETVDASLLANGDIISIDGTVNGDSVNFGRSVSVKGDVKGDLVCFCQSLEVNGTVEGNVYAFSQTVNVTGHVNRTLLGWIQTLHIEPGGEAGDIIAGAAGLRIRGKVDRDVTAFAGAIEIAGQIGRDLQAYAGHLNLLAPARVGGNLDARVHSRDRVHIEPGATVMGKTNYHFPRPPESRYAHFHFYFWQAVWLAAALVTGLLLNWLVPTLFRYSPDRSGGITTDALIGFLVLVVTPIAVVICALTLVGLPIAVATLFLWLTGLYIAKIVVASLIGRSLIKSPGSSFALILLLGLLIIFVVINIPYLGALIKSLVLIAGLGIASTRLWRLRRRPEVPATLAQPLASA